MTSNPGPGALLAHGRRIKIEDRCCRVCGGRRHIQTHHLVHRNKIGSKHPLVHHQDNLIPLCHDCHQHHHTTAHRRVPRDVLHVAEVAFIAKYASLGWLDLWYPKEDNAHD